jgi:gamma-glutamylcyclotransferase
MFYFAYGSNMNHAEMQKRCPRSNFLGRAYLESYKFVFDGYSKYRKCPVANIVQSHQDNVWGGLYKITEEDLEALNVKEGFPKTYQRRVVEVVTDNTNCEAITYLRNGQPLGSPNDTYRGIVIRGASDCELPTEYIDKYIR